MRKVTVIEAESMIRDDLDAMRREYTKMRDIAQKRIKRMSKTEFRESETYKQNKDGFKKLRDIPNLGSFAKAFSELSKFVNYKGSTLKGQKEMKAKTSATLNKSIGAKPESLKDEEEEEQNYSKYSVNPKNYWRVVKILNEARKMKITYDSETMVELAELTLGLSSDQFDTILDNLSTFLEHSSLFETALHSYMNKYDVDSFQEVDIKDLKEKTGW